MTLSVNGSVDLLRLFIFGGIDVFSISSPRGQCWVLFFYFLTVTMKTNLSTIPAYPRRASASTSATAAAAAAAADVRHELLAFFKGVFGVFPAIQRLVHFAESQQQIDEGFPPSRIVDQRSEDGLDVAENEKRLTMQSLLVAKASQMHEPLQLAVHILQPSSFFLRDGGEAQHEILRVG